MSLIDFSSAWSVAWGMAFEELKQRQSAMWGSGPYQRVTETIADLHELLVSRLEPAAGKSWLDLACGTGAVAERAARAGAKVTGVDLAPALLEQAQQRARAEGLEIDYRVGDCERLDGIDDGAVCGYSAAFEPVRLGKGRSRAGATRRRLRAAIRTTYLGVSPLQWRRILGDLLQ